MCNRNGRTRVACYALIGKNSGSLGSAHFLIIEELLKRGYEIDFYAIKGFNNPDELINYSNFNYLPVSLEIIQSIWGILEKMKLQGSILYAIFSRISTSLYFRTIAINANKEHKINPYDLLLIMGLPSFFKIKGVPTISWLQGTFQTEGHYIGKLKDKIILLCGVKEYLKLKLFYIYREWLSRKIVSNTDIFICGSQWSKEMLSSWGLDNNKIKVLPYPIDTDFFHPKCSDNKKDGRITFLWLGRIVPRKRLDLLLEASTMLVKKNKNVYLKIIGFFPYAKTYQKLIDNFEFPERLTYHEGIGRLDVPELMDSVDVLIQPSEGENFGSSVAEALCCGVPVIVGETNGTKDYIGSSFIFEQYSSECLKNTMELAISTLEKNREKTTLSARLTAEKEFNVVTVIDKMEIIFAEATRK